MTKRGILETGIEGAYDSVSCSTGYDRPALGVSQWEGERADALLTSIPGGRAYAGRGYAELLAAGALPALAALISSPLGRRVQEARLYADCLVYQEALAEFDLLSPAARVYAGMWCPTSTAVVCAFIRRRLARDIGSAAALHRLFFEEYARAADAEAWREGYEARARLTLDFVEREMG